MTGGHDTVEVAVTGSGTGIPAQEQARLVQPFERGSYPRRPFNRQSLGLAIAHKVATAPTAVSSSSLSASLEGSASLLRLPRHSAYADARQRPRSLWKCRRCHGAYEASGSIGLGGERYPP